MATLTNSDYLFIVRWLRFNPDHKVNLLTSGLTKAELASGLQALEDWMVAAYNTTPTESWQAAMETAIGKAISLQVAISLWAAWSTWKGLNV